MGTGDLNYARQTETFAPIELNEVHVYRYNPTTFAFSGYEKMGQRAPVKGQELDAEGRVYLNVYGAWASGTYQTDPALMVYA
jgi:hypothetical protein